MRHVCVLLLFCSTLFSQTFSPNIRINDDAGNRAQKVPTIRIDRNGGLYVLWVDTRTNSNGDIYMATSTDGGNTFSPNRPVYRGGKVPGGNQRRPNFAIDGLGRIHVVWVEQKINNQPDVFYTRSEDAGLSFSVPVSLSDDASKWAQDFPAIAVDAENHIYVAFVDARDQQQGLDANHQIYFTKSTDGGMSFTKPKRVSWMPEGFGGSCECCAIDIAVTAQKVVYLAYRSNINNRRDIFISRSKTGGDTFDPAIPAASQSWMIDACPMTGPSVTLDQYDNLHVVWRDARQAQGGKDNIFYAVLLSNADVCGPDLKISDSPRQTNYATVGVLPSGAILIVYQDNRTDAMDVYYTTSVDGGNTFSTGNKLTDESPNSRQEEGHLIVGDDGVCYIVWQDARRDAGDVFFTRAHYSPVLITPDVVRLLSPNDASTLSYFTRFEWSLPDNLSSDINTVYDLSYVRNGTPVQIIKNIKGRTLPLSLPDGNYRWWIDARTITGRSPKGTEFTFTLQTPTSVKALIFPSSLKLSDVYPNPLQGRKHVSLDIESSTTASIAVIISNTIGIEVIPRFVREISQGMTTLNIPIAELNPGMYFITVLSRDNAEARILLIR